MGAVSRVASLGFMLQLVFIYVFGALLKTDAAWHGKATAVYLALSLDQFATAAGVWLRNHFELTRVLTRFVYWLELAGPALLFIPFRNGFFRIVAFVLFMGMHIGFDVTMRIGLFSWIMCAAWLAILPREFWEWIERKWALGSWLDRCFAHPRLLATCAAIDRALPLRPPAPSVLRTREERRSFRYRWLPRLTAGFCGVCIVYVFLWNLRYLDFKKWEPWLPRSANWFGQTLRIAQGWTMFAPKPRTEDGWYILEAKLANGKTVDLLNGGAPVGWGKPAMVSATFKDVRWQKLMLHLRTRFKYGKPYVASYLCRVWNEKHPKSEQVKSYQFWFMLEKTVEPGQQAPPVKRLLLWKNPFFGVSAKKTKPKLVKPGELPAKPTPRATLPPSPSPAVKTEILGPEKPTHPSPSPAPKATVRPSGSP